MPFSPGEQHLLILSGNLINPQKIFIPINPSGRKSKYRLLFNRQNGFIKSLRLEDYHDMNQYKSRFRITRLVLAPMTVGVMLAICGLTAFGAPLPSDAPQNLQALSDNDAVSTPDTDKPDITPAEFIAVTPTPNIKTPKLLPFDVQNVFDGDTRQIIKSYNLAEGENPVHIPRESFELNGWHYTFADMTEKKNISTDKQSHTEKVEINTGSNDLNEIIAQLSPTRDYQSEDGYSGTLTLDLSSVKCETAGYRKESYTVSATREYPSLSSNDLSLIPKTINNNGSTLQLADVQWDAQNTTNVDYNSMPVSYCAVAKYTGSASRSVVTGYITTAEYTGEITKTVQGDTVYTAIFLGIEIPPTPTPTPTSTPTPTATPEPMSMTPTETPKPHLFVNNSIPLILILGALAILAALAGAGAFLFLRHNVKVYRENDGQWMLIAKDKINVKKPIIDLTPLEANENEACFRLEIDKLAAKSLNGREIKVRFGTVQLEHVVAFEGNTYTVEVDFNGETIKAVY
jgi:hypothetical protein